jgi:hypothetical protein
VVSTHSTTRHHHFETIDLRAGGQTPSSNGKVNCNRQDESNPPVSFAVGVSEPVKASLTFGNAGVERKRSPKVRFCCIGAPAKVGDIPARTD